MSGKIQTLDNFLNYGCKYNMTVESKSVYIRGE